MDNCRIIDGDLFVKDKDGQVRQYKDITHPKSASMWAADVYAEAQRLVYVSTARTDLDSKLQALA